MIGPGSGRVVQAEILRPSWRLEATKTSRDSLGQGADGMDEIMSQHSTYPGTGISPDNPLGRWSNVINAWMTEPRSADPVAAAFQQVRGYIGYHRDINDPARADAMEWILALIEGVIGSVSTMVVTYEIGAAVSIWEYGTIKNKVSAGEIPGGNGKVALAALPICPKKARALHAVVGTHRINDVKTDEAEAVADEAAQRATARATVDAMRKRQSVRKRG